MGVVCTGFNPRDVAAQSHDITAKAITGTADVLAQTISWSLSNVRLGDALLELRRTHNISLAWSADIVPTDARVSLRVQNTSLRNVLSALLANTGLQVVVTRQGTIVIVPSASKAPGTDSVPSGPPPRTLERGLAGTGVQQLDQIVVMGSSVASAPEREQPTSITVVSSQRLSELTQFRMTDVLRTTAPGLMMWDRGPTGPPPQVAAVRGVASFTTRALKTYVDGVELASPELFTLVDARAIERIEMISGPQGAALYGPDALNGVLQLKTRHGRLGQKSVGGRLDASGGVYERQELIAAQPAVDVGGGVTGSHPRGAFDLSGAFSNVGRDSASQQLRSWSAQGGGRALLGTVLLEFSSRTAQHRYMAKRVAGAASSPGIPQEVQERAFAVSLTHQTYEKWQQSLVVGNHWISGDREPFRSPLLPPRLPAGATFETAARTSVRYASKVAVAEAVEFSGGAEYSVRSLDRELRRSSPVLGLLTRYRDDLRSTGAFVQTRVRAGSHLVLSGGGRTERISSVGAHLGNVWASTAGVSWNHEFNTATLRVRGAWGRGIRPPEPGMNRSFTTNVLQQVANPELAPERQQGVEGGADLFLQRGVVLKATLYQQFATDLIQQVTLRTPMGIGARYQFQNVGIVRNRGIELEGGIRTQFVSAGLTLHVPRSEVRQVAPRYTGELIPGDQLIEVPEAAGSAFLRYTQSRWSAEVGATGLGPWTGYDWQLLARVERGEVTRRDAVRDYQKRYPGFVRPYVTASLNLPGDFRALLRVDNPANTAAYIRDNASPTLGRTALIGFQFKQ